MALSARKARDVLRLSRCELTKNRNPSQQQNDRANNNPLQQQRQSTPRMSDSLCRVRIVSLLRWAFEATQNPVDDPIVSKFGQWHNVNPNLLTPQVAIVHMVHIVRIVPAFHFADVEPGQH